MALLLGNAEFGGKKVIGVDEAGRGPLAGPVVAAGVEFYPGFHHARIRDSKKVTAKERVTLSEEIKRVAKSWAIISVGPKRIDRINILQAVKKAMFLVGCKLSPEVFLIDGNQVVQGKWEARTVVKGDSKYLEIAAASILAKVHRDAIMRELDHKYPGYGLDRHSGYSTAAHRLAIQELGPSRIHRLSFRGCLPG